MGMHRIPHLPLPAPVGYNEGLENQFRQNERCAGTPEGATSFLNRPEFFRLGVDDLTR